MNMDIFKDVFKAILSGDWRLACAFALIALVAALKWALPKLNAKMGAFFSGDIGGSLLVLGGSFGAELVAAHALGKPWSWGLAKAAGLLAMSASGGYALLKKLLWPMALKLGVKLGLMAPPAA